MAGCGVQFGLLGPLVLADGEGRRAPVAGARLRVLLAALLLQANVPVSGEALADAVWDGAPPPLAGRTLRSHIARLRRILGSEAGRIVARDPGYLVRVGPGELDVLEFESCCLRAGSALRDGTWAQASDAAARALALWRGEPLLDVPSQLLRDRFVPRLEQLRLQALEDGGEAALYLGRYEQTMPQLRKLTTEHPLRERLHVQLVQALACTGRRAEALEAYRDARRMLVDELGIEPGPELRDLHARILAGDDIRPTAEPSADRAPAPGPAPAPASAPAVAIVPRQLPVAPGHYTGRRSELEWLTGPADRSEPAAGGVRTVVISAIDGMAGIGKTALAVRAAHRLAERFPGGQLFADLHGYTKGYPPRGAGEVLEAFLRALGVPTQQIPDDTEQRAALYRQRLVDSRTLILLDNAADEAQVRPLLPAEPGCLVLVTSRRRLKGLDDAHSLSLDLLPLHDAVALLRAVAGPDRMAADDPLLGEVAQLCGRLPLAVRIAGALLRHRPAWSLEYLAALLRDPERRIPVLCDGERDLATVLDLSYAGLDEQHRLLLRRLGLIPGPDLDAYAAAALAQVDPATATRLLEDLVDNNLLIDYAPGRYRLHDLLRAHTHTLAATDPEPDRDRALDRLLHYYAHTALSASVLVSRYPRPAPGGPASAHVPALNSPETARAWLRTERDNLEAAYAHACAAALYGHALALAAGLAEILRADGPFSRALELHQSAAEIAEQHGSPATRAAALTDLGIARRLTGDPAGAAEALSRALELYRASGDRQGEATALTDLGRVRSLVGDLAGAVEAHARALEIRRAVGDRPGEASALTELGHMRHLSGDLTGAVDALTRALELHRATGQRQGEAAALTDLGRVRHLTGDPDGATVVLSRALEIYRAIGQTQGEATTLIELGTVRRSAGDLAGAAEALSRALEIYRAAGHRGGEATALTELGIAQRLGGNPAVAAESHTRALELYRAIGQRSNEAWALNHYAATVAAHGDVPRARALYQQALAMNRELNKPDDEALALEGLGECELSAGEPETAAAYLRQALEIFRRLGMAPDADRVQSRLDQQSAL